MIPNKEKREHQPTSFLRILLGLLIAVLIFFPLLFLVLSAAGWVQALIGGIIIGGVLFYYCYLCFTEKGRQELSKVERGVVQAQDKIRNGTTGQKAFYWFSRLTDWVYGALVVGLLVYLMLQWLVE